MHNPFRDRRRTARIDMYRNQIRGDIEPVPAVVCTQCECEEPMNYRGDMSRVTRDYPVIEAVWECGNCELYAFGYVTEEGLTPVLDNARPFDDDNDDE